MKLEVINNNEVIGNAQNVELKDNTYVGGRRINNLTISRILLKKEKVADIFSRGYLHAASQSYPLNISVKQDDTELLKINNIWICSDPALKVFMSGDHAIIEGIVCEYEYVSGLFSNK